MGGGYMPGQAYRTLGYNYQLPSRAYTADAGWNGWDLATAQYGANGPGGRGLERDWLDTIVNRVGSYFSSRRMTDNQARDAHQRVYHHQEPERMGYEHVSSHTLGGAAAFEAFLIWDRDYHGVYEGMPGKENRDRLVSMAVGEVYALWERLGLLPLHVQPTRTLSLQDAAETAAATAKYLFDHHYMDERHERHRRRRSGSSESTGASHHSRSTRHHGHHSRNHSHSRAHSHHSYGHGHGHGHDHHRQHADMALAASLEHSREREAAYRGQTAAPGMTAGMVPPGMGHRPPGMGMGPLGGAGGMPAMFGGMGMHQGMNGGMNPGMMGNGMMGHGMMGNGMMGMPMSPMGGQFMQPGMMPGMPGMMGGGGAIAHPGHSSAMYYGNNAGQMMENQMMAQHQAMHGQAVPGMNPEYALRMDGEGPVPGTRQYTEAYGYGAGQGMYGGYGQGQGGGYGYPRGSWYGRG